VSRLERTDGPVAVESQLDALLSAGHSRTDATRALIEQTTSDARLATTVVLVEGLSDQIVLEVLAEHQGRALRAAGTFIVPTGGVTNFARYLALFGPRGRDVRLAGLYDSPVEDRVRRSLEKAGISPGNERAGLETCGFYGCVTDLEDEMIRALGPGQWSRSSWLRVSCAHFGACRGCPSISTAPSPTSCTASSEVTPVASTGTPACWRIHLT
jgi:hypothetical protein